MSNFNDEVVQGLVQKIKTLDLTELEKDLLNHLFDAATALTDAELEGAAGGFGAGAAPSQMPSPLPRGRVASPDMPGGGPAAKLRRF